MANNKKIRLEKELSSLCIFSDFEIDFIIQGLKN